VLFLVGVMPPDEHAQNINNSIYTNVGAKLSIQFARYAACLLGRNEKQEVPDDWLSVANRLYLPFDKQELYHPEYEGYMDGLGIVVLVCVCII
jgi:trehalose/maltose hydrolase-like predicted phosphorylase